jgi:hypothetical protein
LTKFIKTVNEGTSPLRQDYNRYASQNQRHLHPSRRIAELEDMMEDEDHQALNSALKW